MPLSKYKILQWWSHHCLNDHFPENGRFILFVWMRHQNQMLKCYQLLTFIVAHEPVTSNTHIKALLEFSVVEVCLCRHGQTLSTAKAEPYLNLNQRAVSVRLTKWVLSRVQVFLVWNFLFVLPQTVFLVSQTVVVNLWRYLIWRFGFVNSDFLKPHITFGWTLYIFAQECEFCSLT